jgi:hypothetical protein
LASRKPQILRCGYDTVRTAIECGDLPALQLNKRHTVLLREDVIEYVRVYARRKAQERKVIARGYAQALPFWLARLFHRKRPNC